MNYYEILGVDEKATLEEIRRAYRTKSKSVHPDAGGSEEQMAQLNAAHDCLSDPERRKMYDDLGFEEPNNVDIDKEAQDIVMMGFEKILLSSRTKDYVESLVEHMYGKLEEFESSIKRIKYDRKSLKSKRSRVKRKDGKTNLFHVIVDNKLKELARKRHEMEYAVKITNRAIEMLKEYKSVNPSEPEKISYSRRGSDNEGDFVAYVEDLMNDSIRMDLFFNK